MKKNAIAGAGLALVLALAPASLAFAEDPVEPPVSAPVVAEEVAPVIDTPAPDPVAAEEPTAPLVVAPVEAPVEQPVVTEPEVSVLTNHIDPIVDVWFTWQIGTVYTANPRNADDVSWPQTLVGEGIIEPTECGVWYQHDRYKAKQSVIDEIISDSTLTLGEDFSIVKEWSFTYSGDCAPEPLACVTDGAWYTEGDDVAPTHTPAGYVFESTESKVAGLRQAASGNLQGWAPVSYVATGEDLGSFWYRLTLDTSADGGWGYMSATVTGGQPVTLDSEAYVSKLGDSFTLRELAELYPNNVITSVGFHLDRGNGPVTLSSVSGGCGSFDFTYTPEPEVVVPNPQAVIVSTCGAATATLTNPGSEGVVTQTASFIIEVDGEFYGAYAVEQDGSLDVPFTFAEDSGDHIIQVFQAGISEWAKIAEAQVESDCVTPEPTPTPEEPTETPVPVTPATTAANLAQTGANPVAPWIGGGILALLLGVGATLLARRNQRTE